MCRPLANTQTNIHKKCLAFQNRNTARSTVVMEDIFKKNVRIMIAGCDGIGKHTLANAVLKETSRIEVPEISMKIDLLSHILPENNLNWLDYDLIIVMVDLTKAHSMEILEQVRYLNRNFFVGKMCFVILGTKLVTMKNVGLDEIAPTISQYHVPVLYGHSKSPTEFEILASQLKTVIMVASGLITGMTPCNLASRCTPFSTTLV